MSKSDFKETRFPSFPEVASDSPIEIAAGQRWQVLCGDHRSWRIGVFSPEKSSAEECVELEKHTCPELFLLLDGRLTLVLARNREIVKLPLELGKPVLVRAPHAGFCPDGPHSGRALVVERDEFDTEYRPAADWLREQTLTIKAKE
ncbi:MAG: hypothetical protein JXR96_22510 [Deltaproteobacteria bacterium]|nr:hypothetical protein [Deltaproteobacteria bacterium]